jgi:Fur family transcriptional regulator, stress-responsive regulator
VLTPWRVRTRPSAVPSTSRATKRRRPVTTGVGRVRGAAVGASAVCTPLPATAVCSSTGAADGSGAARPGSGCQLTIVVDKLTAVKTVDELTSRFRDQGLRVTPQRQAIFRLLHGVDTHPTVESLYEAARAEMPTISRKTVYQTVHDLEAMGEVELLDIGTGSIRVDPNVEHAHQHLVCTRCGTVRDVLLDIADLRMPSRYRRQFTVEAVEVVFRGVCEDCLARDPVDA